MNKIKSQETLTEPESLTSGVPSGDRTRARHRSQCDCMWDSVSSYKLLTAAVRRASRTRRTAGLSADCLVVDRL